MILLALDHGARHPVGTYDETPIQKLNLILVRPDESAGQTTHRALATHLFPSPSSLHDHSNWQPRQKGLFAYPTLAQELRLAQK